MSLNGSTFRQGATYSITLTLSDPDADHALNPDGFQTAGYELSMIAKQNSSLADDHATSISIPSNRFTITATTEASFQLLPSDTSGLTIKGSKVYFYEVWFKSTSAPETNAYPLMTGQFTLTQSVED